LWGLDLARVSRHTKAVARPPTAPGGMSNMPMLEGNRQPQLSGTIEAGPEPKQRRQMLIALALLLIALILVVFKDRQFWFPASPMAESESVDDTENPVPEQAHTKSPTPAPVTHAKAKPHNAAPAAEAPAPITPVVTNRAVLPPLEVEVVAGDSHRTITPGNPAVKLDLQPPVSASVTPPASSDGQVNAAAEHVNISRSTAQIVSRPVQPNYPLLAKQMKVQGSVVLQALIGKDGNIQDLHVLSGPAILSAAAREAVKQWRFKPYYQSGQAVDTEARITVNFTISTY